MQSVTRWKVACMLFAATAGVFALRAHGFGRNTSAAQVEGRSGGLPWALRRPFRVAAGVVGISERDLIDRIVVAKSLRDVQLLCEKLGVIGTDEAVEALSGMVADPRFGVPAAILGAFAAIGTAHAIDAVIQAVDDDRPSVRSAAIESLGASQSEKAEQLLLQLVAKPGDPAKEAVIAALGNLASDRAVTALIDLARSSNYSIASSAVAALGTASTPAAETALRTLLDATDSRIAAAALGAIQNLDDAVLAKITAIIQTGTSPLVQAALSALTGKGVAALPVLREAALHGTPDTRLTAIRAIGSVGGDDAIALLGEVMNTGDRRAANYAAGLLAGMGGEQARGLLIEAALSDRAQVTGALFQLSQLSGDDVDQALLSVVRQGSSEDRCAALPRLVKTGNAEALTVAIDLATKGPMKDRREAIRLLADSQSPQAFEALVNIASQSNDPARSEVLAALAQSHPTNPAVGRLLSESLLSGRRDEVAGAANLLGYTGTESARGVLLSALAGKDPNAANAAVSALGHLGLTPDVKAALLAAASSNDSVKLEVMTQLVDAGAAEGIGLAREILEGKDVADAARAIHVLSQQGNVEAKQLLDRALQSKEPSLRAAALSSVADDRKESSIDTLLRFVRDDDAEVRATAFRQLSQLGSEPAQNALLAAARHGASEDRAVAVQWLWSIEDSRNTNALTGFMRDPDPQVAIAAITASRGGPEVNTQLVRLIHDPNIANEVKNTAAAQLQQSGESTLDPATQAVIDRMKGVSEDGQVVYDE